MPAKNWDSRPGDKNTILFDVQTRLNRKKAGGPYLVSEEILKAL